MKKFFLSHCSLYRKLICKLFGKYNVSKLYFPCGILGDFNICYVGYDKDGNVKKGFTNILDAIKNRGDLGLTVLYD